jgi:hypothetical protein
MKKITLSAALTILFVSFLWHQTVSARELFGNARIEKGALTIVRSGQMLIANPQEPAEIQKNDLLLVGGDSLVNWQIDQDTLLQFGSNAILMARAWKRAGSAGDLNLTYGIARVQLQVGEGSSEPVVLRTPSAIIRLTGSVWVQVALSGSTMLKAVTGETKISNLSGKTQTLSEGSLALVVNGDLIIPDAETSAELQQVVDPKILNMPGLNDEQAPLLMNESELVAVGVVTEDAIQQSKRIEVSIEESFDEQMDGAGSDERKQPVAYPINEDLTSELNLLNDMESMDVDSESDELGVIQVMIRKPETVFNEFDKPKVPGRYFDLDDKTTWSSESGLIAVTIEK